MALRALALALAALSAGLSGCGTLGYYAQAIGGHAGVMGRMQPVEEVIRTTTDAGLKRKLQAAQEIREFASHELQLPDNNSYRTYADLRRPYVVWNIVAVPEFSMQPRQWCFAVVGCVAYRGYYEKSEARAFAEQLRADGFDVHVGGVRAYSTLGWFDDPLLNTMLTPRRPYLAGVMFHELAHQQLYIDNDSAFNEAFATAVERAGVERWIAAKDDAELAARYQRMQRARQIFLRLALAARKRLIALYDSELAADKKRARKVAILDETRAERATVMAEIGFPEAYASFFDDGLNNARLASIATYYDLVPAFEQLLHDQAGDLKRFYAAAQALGQQTPEERAAALATLTGRAKQQHE